MSARTPEEIFRRSIRDAARKAFGVEPDPIPLTYPPNPDLGDLASPVCFSLARSLRKAPRDIAAAIVETLEPQREIERVETAGKGYINAFLDRPALLKRFLLDGLPAAPAADGPKIIIEHTNINPNKAAHIGHLRNAVLGDTLVRFLRRLGRHVEVQNYIDDTGVQVGDLVVGFHVLRGETLDEVERRYAEDELQRRGERFDYVAWDLYAQVTRFYEEDPERLTHRREVLRAIEERDNPIAALAGHVSRRMVGHHLKTMARLDVRYDVLPRESDILGLKFWDRAFGLLREAGAIHLVEQGKNAGCWVMDLPGLEDGAGEDQKIIVRSDGIVTYVGKDIAYQLWKFGLLGLDFRYEIFDWQPQEALYPVWATCTTGGSDKHPPFGRGSRVYNVIDTRQSYPQRVVAEGLRRLGHDSEADRSIHYSYEMVALSIGAVETLLPDYPLSDEERTKAYIDMSGRKGLGVRADDLLDALEQKAAEEVRSRNKEMPAEVVQQTARDISVGALRYYMLRFSRNRVVAFDLDAALSFEGETGPYLQYSVVRARNILAKVAERFGDASISGPGLAASADLTALPAESLAEHWNLVSMLLRVEAVIRQAVESLELSAVAKHTHALAQSFNSFYHHFQVAGEEDATIRATRIGLVRLYHDGMVELLGRMGIAVPDRM